MSTVEIDLQESMEIEIERKKNRNYSSTIDGLLISMEA
jgi:hypothetical protein